LRRQRRATHRRRFWQLPSGSPQALPDSQKLQRAKRAVEDMLQRVQGAAPCGAPNTVLACHLEAGTSAVNFLAHGVGCVCAYVCGGTFMP